jgi:hypothetical protein
MVSEQNSVYKKKAGPLLALPECRGLVMPGGGIEPPISIQKNSTTFPLHQRSIKWDGYDSGLTLRVR